MRVGVPKEVKIHEYRVGLVPGSVRELVLHGHEVVVETQAGAAIGFPDAAYAEAGARIAPDAAAVFDDRPLAKMTLASMRAVLAPKVAGGWALHKATEALALDFFILYSSRANLSKESGFSKSLIIFLS